jgi:hypothetical protein
LTIRSGFFYKLGVGFEKIFYAITRKYDDYIDLLNVEDKMIDTILHLVEKDYFKLFDVYGEFE